MNLFTSLSLLLIAVGTSTAAVHPSAKTWKTDFHAPSQSKKTTPCDGTPVVPSKRKACGFYIWDAPSALLYKWCNHLLKDYLYEGKGGKMFVRYESNSILQLLYPCSRYSPSRCLVCGGSYEDHLDLWWSKRLYTPFDQQLDKTYDTALRIPEEKPAKSKNKGRKSNFPAIVKSPSFSFHRRYVEDVSDTFQDKKSKQKQVDLVRKKLSKQGQENNGWSMRSFPRFKVAYVEPPAALQDEKKTSFLYRYTRSLVLNAFSNFVYLQETENEKLQNKT